MKTSSNVKVKKFMYGLLVSWMFIGGLSFAEITVKVNGEFQGAVGQMIDGEFVEPGSAWDGDGCVFWTTRSNFIVVNLGSVVQLNDLLIQVDNNDSYRIDYSSDGNVYHRLMQIDASLGEIESGMETFSTVSSQAGYAAEIDVQPVLCQYLKIATVDGDEEYAIAEIQALTSAVGKTTPIPGTTKIKTQAIGAVVNSTSLVVDGLWVEKGANWDSPECVHWLDRPTAILLDLGTLQSLQELTVQADNNDSYQIDYSADGKVFQKLCTIDRQWGEMDSGMDIFSSQLDHANYQSEMDFHTVQARFIKIHAIEGDDSYAIAEIQVIAK